MRQQQPVGLKEVLETNRSHLHHLQLDVLWLGQAAACCLRHRNVLDSLVIALRRAIVCGQGLRKLRHGLGQQVGGLRRERSGVNTPDGD